MTESPVLEVTTVISGCPVFTIRFSVLFITNHALRSASSCCGHLAIVEKVNNQEENTFLGSTSEIRSEKPAKRVLSKIPDFLFGGSCGRKLQNSGSSRISPFLPVDTSRIRQRERHFYTNNHVTQNTGIQVIAIPFIFETEIGVINTRRPSVRHDTVSWNCSSRSRLVRVPADCHTFHSQNDVRVSREANIAIGMMKRSR